MDGFNSALNIEVKEWENAAGSAHRGLGSNGCTKPERSASILDFGHIRNREGGLIRGLL